MAERQVEQRLAEIKADLGPFGDLSGLAAHAVEGMFDLNRAQAHSVAAEVCGLIRAALAEVTE